MSDTAIELSGLSFAYPDGRRALNGVDLLVQRGERLGLIGANGAGKSTLLLHLNGLLRGQGEIVVGGLRLANDTVRRIRARIGLVFQDPDDQLFSPTVYEDVAFGPLHMGLGEEEVRERVARSLALVGMAGFGSRLPYHLSLGEKKKVALATVLSMEPEVLALDEPSAGLDPAARDALLELLARLPQTMIIASHDLAFVAQACHRAVILDAGRIVGERRPAELVGLEGAPLPAGSGA